MTVAQLVAALQGCPDQSVAVRYNYDGGHDHPELVSMTLEDDPLQRGYGQYVLLDEQEPD